MKLAHRTAAGQYGDGVRVRWGNRRPGDLVFWSSTGTQAGIHHVGMYIGNGQIVEAANHRADLRVRSVSGGERELMPYVTRVIR
jgi:cell wall-associated NlpC family hydrolase